MESEIQTKKYSCKKILNPIPIGNIAGFMKKKLASFILKKESIV